MYGKGIYALELKLNNYTSFSRNDYMILQNYLFLRYITLADHLFNLNIYFRLYANLVRNLNTVENVLPRTALTGVR